MANIKNLIFDLDDTIYSQSSKMSECVTARIKEYSIEVSYKVLIAG